MAQLEQLTALLGHGKMPPGWLGPHNYYMLYIYHMKKPTKDTFSVLWDLVVVA